MTPDRNRIDWLRVTFWGVLFVAAGLLLLGFCGWLLLGLEQAIGTYGPWVTAHADIIAGTVIVIAVSIAWQLAKKDTPSW